MTVQNGAYTRTYSFAPGDDRILPRFFIESIPDPLASEREGRPIFRDQERVELLSPGNTLNIPVEIVSDVHRERWAKQYAAFKQGIEMSGDGTPLEQWPILKRSQVLELKALNFFTVEDVAKMNDHACQRMMAGMRLRTLAKAFLDDAVAAAELSRVTAENERKNAEIHDLKTKVEQLSSLLNSVHADMQTMRNAPSPLATMIPGMSDPIEQARQAAGALETGGHSSLDSLPDAPRRRRKSEQPAA